MILDILSNLFGYKKVNTETETEEIVEHDILIEDGVENDDS